MEQRTAQTVFLGALLASVATALLLTPSARAEDGSIPSAPQSERICTETVCIDVVDLPVVELAPAEATFAQAADADLVIATDFTMPDGDIPTLALDATAANLQPVLGRIAPDASSAADDWLGNSDGSMLENHSHLRPVESVTGLGLVSRF